MKTIVSVSLGASDRDHETNIILLNEEVNLKRIGTNGDLKKAVEIINTLDGKVDGIGLGGIDLHIFSSKKNLHSKMQ